MLGGGLPPPPTSRWRGADLDDKNTLLYFSLMLKIFDPPSLFVVLNELYKFVRHTNPRCLGDKMSNRDFNISSHSEMYWKVYFQKLCSMKHVRKSLFKGPDLSRINFSLIIHLFNLGRAGVGLHAEEVGFFKDETAIRSSSLSGCALQTVYSYVFVHRVRSIRAHSRAELPDGGEAQGGGKKRGALPN